MKPERFGRYLLLERLSADEDSEVFFARSVEFDPVAVLLERVRPDVSARKAFVECFVRETWRSRAVDHPNVWRLSDSGDVDGAYFVARKVRFGVSLDRIFEVASAGEPLDHAVAALIALDLALALEAIHNRGFAVGAEAPIHREVRPEHVTVDADGQALLSLSGLAKARRAVFHHSAGRGELARRDPAYLPASVAHGASLNIRSDLHALGVILWELLSAQRPYSGRTAAEIQAAVLASELPPPSSLVSTVPEPLDRIVLRAVGAGGEDPHRNAGALIDDLRSFLDRAAEARARADLRLHVRERFGDEISALHRRFAELEIASGVPRRQVLLDPIRRVTEPTLSIGAPAPPGPGDRTPTDGAPPPPNDDPTLREGPIGVDPPFAMLPPKGIDLADLRDLAESNADDDTSPNRAP